MKAVKKNVKILLDVVVFLLLVLMYRKQAMGMLLHEVGGLLLIVLFVVHHVFNGAWISAVTRRLFTKELPPRTRVSYIVDALMLVAFLCIGVSGVLISKRVFSFNVQGYGWKTLHYFCAALGLLLCGVHIGLHADYLFGGLRRRSKALRAAMGVLLAAVLVFGVYNMATTSFTRWLSMPFSAMPAGVAGEAGQNAPGAQTDDGSEAGSLPAKGDGAHGSDFPGSGKGGMRGNGARGAQGGSLGGALTVLVQFASIAAVFAALTHSIVCLCDRKKRVANANTPEANAALSQTANAEPQKTGDLHDETDGISAEKADAPLHGTGAEPQE